MQFRTVDDLNETILRNLRRIPADVDLIVGIPRSGMLAANILALYRNLPLTDVEGFLEGRLLQSGHRELRNGDASGFHRALVVDDSLARGTQMRKVRERINEARPSARVEYLAVYVLPGSESHVDYALEVIPRPRYFQWNIMHHGHLAHACVDIDGVLCVDPTEEQNDEDARYLQFLENAKPLFIPTPEVGWLVTCRLEKYRALTECWLAKHGVRYRELVMMDAASKEDRRRIGHAAFKARVYRETGANLFIESDPRQATTIAQRSGLSVFCVSTMQLVKPTLAARVPTQLRRLPQRMFTKLGRMAQRMHETLLGAPVR